VPTRTFATVAIARDTARAWVHPRRAAELCAGHFPGDPFLPAAALVGIMAELGAILVGSPGRAPAVVERALFHRPVRPHEQLEVIGERAEMHTVATELRVGSERRVQALLRFDGCP